VIARWRAFFLAISNLKSIKKTGKSLNEKKDCSLSPNDPLSSDIRFFVVCDFLFHRILDLASAKERLY